MERKRFMVLFGLGYRMMITRHLCDNSRPVRFAGVSIDALELYFVAMGEGGLMEDGFVARFKRVGEFLLQADAGERDASDRAFRSFACVSVNML